ncbi:MAG TPA: OFA family MFS transporter [Gemmatimonadaceae bacterium]|jgi:MFS family permease
MALFSFLDRDRTIAAPTYNRWRIPTAALAIHLAIGQAYAFSVFNLPLHNQEGWKLSTIGWVFSTAIVFLGVSAALFGQWLERVGPRKAMFTAACCFSGGFLVGAIGIRLHNFPLLLLGYGVLGGFGLGIGYISPVSTLIRWFPDRPGMATGMAIMGFGGGAMIASPLSVRLMAHFRGPGSQGVAPTFVSLAVLYFIFMMFGVFSVRLPRPGWKPVGWTAPATPRKLVTTANVTVNKAMRTLPFWLLWWVLCLNVTAGIGVLGQASPMIQEMFFHGNRPAAAAGFVALLSLANMAGRFGWASLSDYIGRKATYATFFILGMALYAFVPHTGQMQSVALFVLAFVVILSMYGGGFSTIPAYLKDLFGTMHVGAIHGRLLTAWSAAGIFGPVLVNYIREYQINRGVPKADAYSVTMYLMACLLFVGLICNWLVRPVLARHYFTGEMNVPDTPKAGGTSITGTPEGQNV